MALEIKMLLLLSVKNTCFTVIGLMQASSQDIFVFLHVIGKSTFPRKTIKQLKCQILHEYVSFLWKLLLAELLFVELLPVASSVEHCY